MLCNGSSAPLLVIFLTVLTIYVHISNLICNKYA